VFNESIWPEGAAGDNIQVLTLLMLVNFSSYNLFGFDQGRSLLVDLCRTQYFIAVQELWLSDFNIDKIINFHNDFAVIARLAMSKKIQSGFLRSCPFGGLAAGYFG